MMTSTAHYTVASDLKGCVGLSNEWPVAPFRSGETNYVHTTLYFYGTIIVVYTPYAAQFVQSGGMIIMIRIFHTYKHLKNNIWSLCN